MNPQPLVIASTGMVSCVGADTASSCAAIRAGIANFTESKFMDRAGEWIMAAQVPLEVPRQGRGKLLRFLASAIEECLAELPRPQWARLPLLLCVAESGRPGRLDGLESELLRELGAELGVEFHAASRVVPQGRVAAAVALLHARKLVYEGGHEQVLIAGADSYLQSATMRAYDETDRLLTSANSNGFVAGEGAAAVLVSRPSPDTGAQQLRILGLGFGVEKASVDSTEPLRAQGLVTAIQGALVDGGVEFSKLHYRITDLGGEQYYFRESVLAITRLMREPNEQFDLWHPADCIGDTGAAAGLMCLCVALAAGRKNYAPGIGALLHFASDQGARACAVAMYH